MSDEHEQLLADGWYRGWDDAIRELDKQHLALLDELRSTNTENTYERIAIQIAAAGYKKAADLLRDNRDEASWAA